ncbi:PREDICTED: probable ATP-dependent RNA helicase DDX52 [Chrysochloris asiatica]|uniref:RNA helicase n=1 Tax=Chrysochloris asiatica TaxID=185453 RepID=A0A9B0WHD2_CHRAS|nr:PREDICTED: probable ATP-dependent RNA helicase DDX52 [Chrysochloris asiatica]
MDMHDLFRRLGAGAKFDVSRFSADAARFQLGKRKYDFNSSEALQGIDFFGNKKSDPGECGASRTYQELQNEEKKEARLTERKREWNKKKRKRMASEITLPEEETTIQWMSSMEAKIEDKKVREENKLTSGKLEHLRKEKINFFRNKNKIHVQGTDLPDPIATFQQLDQEYKINSRLLQNILGAGFQVPTAIQMQAIPVMLHGRELLASAPTGSGKTLAFSIPILMQLKQPTNKGFRALIISPTRELASQIHRELLKISEGTGFRIHMIHKAAVAAKKFGPKSSKKFDILVTTPNRLIYLLKQDPPGIDLTSVEWLIVDESDKLFEDGKTGFRDQLASIFLACTSHKIRRAMFSATFAYDVEQWCKLNLDNVITVSIGARNSAVETVEQELLFVGSETGKLLAMRELVKKELAYGRTGRAGHKGKAVTFFTEDDKPLLRSVANVIQQAGCPVPDYIKSFKRLLSKEKKKMVKKPLERESISTTPKCFSEKVKDKQKKVTGQNKKKVALEDSI